MSHQIKEPSPTSKVEVVVNEASAFLSRYYGRPAHDIKELSGGKHSKAFSYEFDNNKLIVRFNSEERGFLKDKYAYEHFGSHVPIPKVVDMGTYNSIYFCITEKINGETIRDRYNKNDFASIPLLYSTVEQISKIENVGRGFGYLDLSGNGRYDSFSEYVKSVYRSSEIFDWNTIFGLEFVDKEFTDYVAQKMEYFLQYASEAGELTHGDFGADNVFIDDNKVSGVIDWEKMRRGDHFLDVGRILLFCPNRKATALAAIEFYENLHVEHWKERAALGLYHVVLTNYAFAALAGNEVSCKSAVTRLDELEEALGIK